VWAFGNDITGHTVNDFGQINQYGPLLRLTYLLFGGLGATTSRFNDFRDIVSGNHARRRLSAEPITGVSG